MNQPIGLSTPVRKDKRRERNHFSSYFSPNADDVFTDEDFSSSSLLLPTPFTYYAENKDSKILDNSSIETSPFPKKKDDDNNNNTTEDTFWWDDEDIDEIYSDIDESNHTPSNNNNNNIIIMAIDANLIRLYNTRCIIHEINLNAFNRLRNVFETYYRTTISNLDSSEKNFSDMIYANFYSNFGLERNYEYITILSHLRNVSEFFFTKRCIIELSRLIAVRNYIINAENYINFQSKCLLDCYYQMKYMYNFNLSKSALRQWRIKSKYATYLDNRISNYAARANNILGKIKKYESHSVY